MKATRREAIRSHFCYRLRERCGVRINDRQYEAMCVAMAQAYAKWIASLPNQKRHVLPMNVPGWGLVNVIYDVEHQAIVTLLTTDMADRRRSPQSRPPDSHGLRTAKVNKARAKKRWAEVDRRLEE